ncbi:hypothetical protein [Luteibacter sp. dw_328]|jgi:hypothetical protein|uniref:hypothetical protein n=1 Tax=Luteibacter sp. dw_328 TaxID=2719796 RepID=UPI001BD5BD36|nr:hypothetical protein [Luteibacter sp. dw_328]
MKYVVTKCALVATAAMMLSACGGKTMIESDMTRTVAASPASPWLTLENKGDHVISVGGLSGSPKVQVSPDIASAIEAQLRTSLQPKYFTDLIIGCRGLQQTTAVHTPDGEPSVVTMDLTVNCRIVARGVVVSKVYHVSKTAPVLTDPPRLDTIVPNLITGASTQLADQLWADVVATGVRR